MTNISKYRRSISLPLVGAALALLSTGFCAVTASAAAAQGAPVFGSVDIGKVMAGYTKKAASDQQVQDFGAKLEAQFKTQIASPMLSAAQQQELGTLLAKTAPTDADRARITELQDTSQKEADQLAALQQVKDPTADQTTQLGVLTKEQQDGQQVLQGLQDADRAALQAENDKVTAQLAVSVRAAIAEVAQAKGITVVFDAQVALYTSNDITDDVTKRLNK